MIDEYTINKFLENNPDASLKDFCNHINDTRAEAKKKEAERRANELQFYKDHIVGHYFLVKFHSTAYTFLGPIPDDICYGNSKLIPSISIYTNTSKGGKRVDMENIHINPLWLENPYSTISGNGPGTKCKEISKEEYEAVKTLLSDTILGINTEM